MADGSTNLEAYNLYLKGRYYWNKGGAEGLKTAMDYLHRAIAKDPGLPWRGRVWPVLCRRQRRDDSAAGRAFEGESHSAEGPGPRP